MLRRLIIGALGATAVLFSNTAFAQGTAAEAKAMLENAVAAVKANEVVALAMFIKGEGGFKDRDLYPFCFRSADGKAIASPPSVPAGTDVRTLKDATGKAFGQELYAAAQKPEGEITEVSYMFPRPGADKTPVPKVSFVTRVSDVGCGVGYYAQSSTMHRYVIFFKYGDNAIKAMTENPQDRSAQGAKVTESFGGKQEAIYFFPTGGEFDGIAIAEFPDDVTAEGLRLFIRATGNFAKFETRPLITAGEFKAAMEKAKSVKSTYTPPTATKQ
jgi:uncharacterized protein with GYD domain